MGKRATGKNVHYVNIGAVLSFGGECHALDEGYIQWFIGGQQIPCPLSILDTLFHCAGPPHFLTCNN